VWNCSQVARGRLAILPGAGVLIADGDAMVPIHGEEVALLVGGHDLVDPLAVGADEAGEIALGQAQGDVALLESTRLCA